MDPVIIGNLISLVGCVLMVLVGFLRKKQIILTVQCFQFGFLATANLILGGMTGFVSGIISIIRNIVFSKAKTTLAMKLLFIAAQVLLSLKGLGGGWVEWLPVFAGGIFTWILDTRNEVVLKTGIIGAQVLWLIYDLCYHNYVAATFDALTILSNLIGIAMVRKSQVNS